MVREFISLDVEEISSVDFPANQRKWLIIKRKEADPMPKVEKFDGSPMTTDEIVAEQEAFDAFWMLRSAFLQSIDSILSFAEAGDQAELLVKTVEEFAASAKPLLTSISQAVKSADVLKDLGEAVSLAKDYTVEERVTRIRSAVEPLQKQEKDKDMATKQELEAKVAEQDEAIAQLKKDHDVMAARNVDLEQTVKDAADLAETQQATIDGFEAKPKDDELEEEEIIKSMSPGQRKLFETQKAAQDSLRVEVDKSREMATKERDLRLKDEFIQKAGTLNCVPGLNPDDCWEVFKNISETMPDAWAKIEELLTAAHNTISKDVLLKKELGKGGDHINGMTDGSALSEMTQKATDMVEAGRAKSHAEGISMVAKSDQPLYARYRNEQRNGQ